MVTATSTATATDNSTATATATVNNCCPCPSPDPCPCPCPCPPTPPPDPLLEVPNYPITGLGISYRNIAEELKAFKNEMLTYPLTQEYIANPTGLSKEKVDTLDILWTVLANKLVNDVSGVPQGYAKSLLICRNDGCTIINVSTFMPNKNLLNYSIVEMNKYSNLKFVENPSEAQYNANIDSKSVTFSAEKTIFSNVIFNPNMQCKKFFIMKCGSMSPPVTDPNNLIPEKTVAVTFEEEPNQVATKEIIQAVNSTYGWAGRYSETSFTPNFYVATKLEAADDFVVFLRLSYFVINEPSGILSIAGAKPLIRA